VGCAALRHAIAIELACVLWFFACGDWFAVEISIAVGSGRFGVAGVSSGNRHGWIEKGISAVAELVEFRSKGGLDFLGIRCGELVLECQNPLRPDC